jgi:hypothetical protein
MSDELNEHLWDYANKVMYPTIKTEDECDKFLTGLKKFNASEKELLKDYWTLITFGSIPYYEDDVFKEEELADVKEQEETEEEE